MTEIRNLTAHTLPELDFKEITDSALGQMYDLSVVFVSKEESERLNATYRNKERPTNILSFPYSETSGEIVLCPDVIEQEALNYTLSYVDYLTYLFIHGLIHLKGYDHSDAMESEELTLRKKFLPKDFVRP